MSSDPPPGFDLSSLIAETQARLVASSTRARTEDLVSPGAVGLDTLRASPGLTAAGSVDPSPFFTPPAVGGRELGVLGESFSGGGAPSSTGVMFPIFEMTPLVMEKLCLGVVAGLKFCTSGKTACSKTSHAKKANVQSGMVYIAGPRSSAFTQIFLDPAVIPRDQLEKSLVEKNTLEAWQRLFGALQEQLLGMAPITTEEFDSLKTRAVNGMSTGVTPHKQTSRFVDDQEETSPWEPLNVISKVSPLGTSFLADIDSETLMAAQMDKLLLASKELLSKFEKMRIAVGEDVDRLEAAVHDVSLKTGKDPGLGDTPLLSAWEGVAFVHANMQEAIQAAGALHNEVAASRRRVEEAETNIMAKVNVQIRQMNRQMMQYGQLLQLLNTENQRLQTMTNLRRRSSPRFLLLVTRHRLLATPALAS
jgi:hypothetical protein